MCGIVGVVWWIVAVRWIIVVILMVRSTGRMVIRAISVCGVVGSVHCIAIH